MTEEICLHHVCLRVSNLRQSEVFYAGFLGLKKLYEFTLSADLAQTLMNVPGECQFISFECPEGGGLEIFSSKAPMPPAPVGNHFCLGVSHREDLLTKFQATPVNIREAQREGRRLVFIEDPDGNLIELKELAG